MKGVWTAAGWDWKVWRLVTAAMKEPHESGRDPRRQEQLDTTNSPVLAGNKHRVRVDEAGAKWGKSEQRRWSEYSTRSRRQQKQVSPRC